MCFAAAGQMLPLRENFETPGALEPLLKVILRQRMSVSRATSVLESVPHVFERIPGLQRSFNDHSLPIVPSADCDGVKYMNITGWMAFCAKLKFHVFFPSLIRSKCISCFMECAKRSYGHTLLMSFRDFCSCLLMLQEAALSQHSTETFAQENIASHFSEADRVAAVVKLLQAVQFFTSLKQAPQRKHHHNIFSMTEESGLLTTNIVLPLLKSVVENESETWTMNHREITVRGSEACDSVNGQSLVCRFRVPFDYLMPFARMPIPCGELSTALAVLTAQVSSVAFSCSSLKLNQPALARQGCSHALKLADFNIATSKSIICDRTIQILAISTIQEALCCSEASKAKPFFGRYHREMRTMSVEPQEQQNLSEDSKQLASTFDCDHRKATGSSSTSTSSRELDSAKLRCLVSVTKINRSSGSTSKNSQTKDAVSQLSQALPELPTEIIRFAHSKCRIQYFLHALQEIGIDSVLRQELETNT